MREQEIRQVKECITILENILQKYNTTTTTEYAYSPITYGDTTTTSQQTCLKVTS